MVRVLKSVLLLSVILVTTVFQGCTTVKPWERGNLSKSIMSWQADPLEYKLQQHIFFSKEGSSGGGSAAGGGCGCN